MKEALAKKLSVTIQTLAQAETQHLQLEKVFEESKANLHALRGRRFELEDILSNYDVMSGVQNPPLPQ